ncbi:MAG: hypothetical protein CMQ19_10385 [Gammaproteobacteria bacterium]|nr:hypothetical protein [Gammaproteobacteria bacterium]
MALTDNHPTRSSQYGFRASGWKDRIPLRLGKFGCFALMSFTSYMSAISDTLEDRVIYLSFLLTLVGMYANLATPKYELRELFDPPLYYISYPIFFCASINAVWYEYLRW